MSQIAQIIKYEGDNTTFIWKHPCEDFNSLTQLIVHESQEAVFMMNGQALDLFGPGRYTLESQNIPMVGKLMNRTTGGDTPFHCEVYFINQTVQMGLKWGTDSRVRYIDPDSGVPLQIGASGEMNMRVLDSRKLLVKLVGTTKGIAWGDTGTGFTKSIQNAFRPMISTEVKSNLTPAIKSLDVNILEVDEHLSELSAILKQKIQPGFEDYGLTIPEFYITTIVLPEEDPNFKRIKDLYTVTLQVRTARAEAQVRSARAMAEADVTAAQRQIEMERQTTQTEIAKREAERKLIEAQAEAEAAKAKGYAEAEVMRVKGYNEKDLIQADVQKAYAAGLGNMGSGGNAGGSAMSDIIGLGIGLKAAGAFGEQLGGVFDGVSGQNKASAGPEQNDASAKQQVCAKCGAPLPENAKFCFECGEKVVPPIPVGMVVCPECGQTVPKGKFCLECGHKFVTVCPKCGNTLPEGAKFCLECGEKL